MDSCGWGGSGYVEVGGMRGMRKGELERGWVGEGEAWDEG